jgi:hypothetical protein
VGKRCNKEEELEEVEVEEMLVDVVWGRGRCDAGDGVLGAILDVSLGDAARDGEGWRWREGGCREGGCRRETGPEAA